MQSSHNANDFYEIDLFELCRELWQQKWLILGITLFSILASGSYAFMETPVYEVKVNLFPPSNSDIADFNYGRIGSSGLSPFSIKDIYSIFAEKLQSDALRRQFFDEAYLPSLSESRKSAGQDKLYADFSKDLVISVTGKDASDHYYTIVVRNQDPSKAVEWANSYAESAGELARQAVIANATKEAGVLVLNYDQQIATLREIGLQVRKDKIQHLEEALVVAKSVGLEQPPLITAGSSSELMGRVDGELAYMRGSKALEAELKNFKSRQSDDAFISGLRDLQTKREFYKGIELKKIDGVVYHSDGKAELPGSPVAPRKVLILALGLLCGVLVGGGVALFRGVLKTNQRRIRDGAEV